MENENCENVFDGLASIEAEQSILGGVLIQPSAMAKCRDLSAGMFYQPQHKMIFGVLLDMAATGKAIDVVSVDDELKNRNQDEEAGGLNYLVEMAQNVPSAVNIARYVQIVKNRHTEREMLKASAEIEKLALSRDGESVEEKCAKATALVSALNKTAVTEKTDLTITESAKEMLDFLQEMAERDGAVIGIPTSLDELDKTTGGMQKGNLVVIAARPSMGKTVLAENIARHATKRGMRVHYQSYEMLQRELIMRSVAAEMEINLGRLKSACMTETEYANLAAFINRIDRWRLSIDTAPLNVEQLALLATDKKINGGLDMLIVDHLHLIPWSGRGNETAELGHITKRLKRLAMELEIPVVLVAQLNRAVAKQTDKRPSMADIRGSGSVEQDANIIIMPHREHYYDEQANPNEAELIIAKNRDGEMKTVVCGFEGCYQRFTDWINPWQPSEKSREKRWEGDI